jgi:hypothetical protein
MVNGKRPDRQKDIRIGENHHWWPISLSKGWARTDGRINTISQFGVPKAYAPKEIAKIEDGHNILIGGPGIALSSTNSPVLTRDFLI